MNTQTRLAAIVLLFAAAAVVTVNAHVCQVSLTGGDQNKYLSRDTHVSGLRSKYHDWMTKKYTQYHDRKLSELAWPGSHDAATYKWKRSWGYTKPEGAPKGAKFHHSITQRFSLLDQLCVGARFFDLRVTYKNGVMRMIHPIDKRFLFDTWDMVLDQIRIFASDPLHKHELIFPRIKCSNWRTRIFGEKCYNIINRALTTLDAHLIKPMDIVTGEGVDFRRDHHQLSGKKWSDLQHADYANDGGRQNKNIFVLAYPDSEPGRVADQLTLPRSTQEERAVRLRVDQFVWNYKGVQYNDFSKSNLLEKVAERQAEKYNTWLAKPQDPKPLFGYWFTSTASLPLETDDNHVAVITGRFWKKDRRGVYPLTKLFDPRPPLDPNHFQFNVLVTDFVGVVPAHVARQGSMPRYGCSYGLGTQEVTYPDWNEVMKLVMQMNEHPIGSPPPAEDGEDSDDDDDNLNNDPNYGFVEHQSAAHPIKKRRAATAAAMIAADV